MTIRIAAETPWYELFSRGARDWLRHNQKVREAGKGSLPALLGGHEQISQPAHSRKTIKEAVKRRSAQEKSAENPVPITNDDLRFRQLVKRERPATNAAVIFALDVSGSMDEAQRRLAKTFFFFALQGIRRQYAKVETVFLAHAGEAWEFEESQFFEAQSSGGTVSSSVFNLAREIVRSRYDPGRF